MIRAPAAIAFDTSAQISSSLALQRRAAAVTSKRPGIDGDREARQVAVVVDVQDLGELVVVDDRERQHDLRQDAGPGASRLCSGPIVPASEVTSSSRMASSGGLVTWANSCEK